jgi:hypothetical protein
MTIVYSELNDRLRRAARNGTRLHLDPAHVAALLAPKIYGVLAAAEAEELNGLCGQDNHAATLAAPAQLSAISSGRSGSGIARTAMTGTSAGMTTEPQMDAVGRAESRRASAAVGRITHRKRHKTL